MMHEIRHFGRSAVLGGTAILLAFVLAGCAGSFNPVTGSSQSPEEGADQRPAPEISTSQEDLLGGWTSDETGNPHLEFMEDSTVKGTDGCNDIATTYEIKDGRVLLASSASTMRACQGVDDWLRAVREVTVDGDTLIVRNGAGDEIGQLQRDGAGS